MYTCVRCPWARFAGYSFQTRIRFAGFTVLYDYTLDPCRPLPGLAGGVLILRWRWKLQRVFYSAGLCYMFFSGTCTIPRTTNPRTTIPNVTIPRTTNPRTDQS